MLQTPQRYPRGDSQAYPSPAATTKPDSSTKGLAEAKKRSRRGLRKSLLKMMIVLGALLMFYRE
jgi:hypothetical protein